jgi:hypothetical protein
MNQTANLSMDVEYRPLRGNLYHYTSLDAVLSIVQQKTLRATNIHYLNDASESELGVTLIRDLARAARREATGVDAQYLDYFEVWLERNYLLQQGAVYVLCFSEVADQLSQWRGYTPHGRGVCVGIDVGLLVQRMQSFGSGWTFQNCRYEKLSQQTWAGAILTRMRRLASVDHAIERRQDHFASLTAQNMSDVMQVAALMKNQSFAAEREVRFISPLITPGDPRVQFRSGKSTLIPYIEFPLVEDSNASLQAADFWIGPGPTQRLSHSALTMLTNRFSFSVATNYRSSEIPYREL